MATVPMRTTVKAKMDDVVDRVAKYVFAETDPSVLLTVDNGVPRSVASMDIDGQTIKRRYRDELRREVLRLKTSFRDQYDHVVAAAAGEDRAAHREGFVDDDLFLEGYEGDRREAFVADLEDAFDEAVDALDPMLTAEVAADGGGSPGFWEAAAATSSADEARDDLDAIAWPRELLEEYGDELALVMDLSDSSAPIDELDHTAETVRTVTEGIDHVVEVEERAIDDAFGA